MHYRLEDKEGIRYLYSGESATQSAINLTQPHKIILKNLEYALGCLMFIPKPQNILLLGVGGGSLIHFFRHYCPNASITGIDIDSSLLQTMHHEFLLPQADSLLTYHIADARDWVKNNNSLYDLIVVDIFNEQFMPTWVLEDAFISDLKQSLSQHGCITWNTLITTDTEFNQFYKSLRSIFQQRTVCLAADDYENTIVYSFNAKLKHADMGHLIQLAEQNNKQYHLPFHEILQVIFNTNPIDSGFI